MSDRDGIFSGEKPMEIFKRWYGEAEAANITDPHTMSLATVDANGLPDLRIVFMKDHDETGISFFTNYSSAKGTQLDGAGKAAVNFYWQELYRQVRFRGRIERLSAAASDAYYNTRALGSRIGAWASQQSQPIESRAALEAAVRAAEEAHGENPERPPHWGGYRLIPSEIEFWAGGEFRLHNRFRWTDAAQSDWTVTRLNP